MPIVNSFSNAVVREFSLEELKQAARLMRGYDLVALCAAGSGHSGGTLSIMDIVAALYLKVANHDPNNPEWKERDRIIWSAGHKAPALYLGPRLRRILSRRRHGYLAQAVFAIPGTSAPLEAAGCRGLQRIVGTGPQHRGRRGAGRQTRRRQAFGVLHHGRRRAAGGQYLGSGHGGIALQARQSGWPSSTATVCRLTAGSRT